MKQGLRFLFKPGTFFNQLQWSRNHWFILASFLGLAFVESQVGKQQALYQNWAEVVQLRLNVGLSTALWIVTAVKLALMMVGSTTLAWTIWFAGNLLGASSSRRVLFRRLSVVFTVLLAGYTASHFARSTPELELVSLGLYFWTILLGYAALREQFGLNHLETAVLGLFATLAITMSWEYGHDMMAKEARKQLVEITRVHSPAMRHR